MERTATMFQTGGEYEQHEPLTKRGSKRTLHFSTGVSVCKPSRSLGGRWSYCSFQCLKQAAIHGIRIHMYDQVRHVAVQNVRQDVLFWGIEFDSRLFLAYLSLSKNLG